MATTRTYYKKTYPQKPAVAPVRPKRDWSKYQTTIFEDVAHGSGNTQVDARAGSGKTTVIVESLYHVPAGNKVLMAAFNASIKKELESRVPGYVDCSTLHGLGRRAVTASYGNDIVVDDKGDKMRGHIEALVGNADEDYDLRESLRQTCSLAKGYLAKSVEDIDVIVDKHGIDTDKMKRNEFNTIALRAMLNSGNEKKRIDFDDMVWYPLHHSLSVPKYRRVFVDETQDLNPAQIQLVLKALDPSGRILTVGDEAQAIYGWRGADANAIGNVVDACNSKRMPLSVTYRCGRAIVELAQQYVPDLEPAPNANPGFVETVGESKVMSLVKPGDFIISRTNAPLIGMCMELIKNRIPANIRGKDIGKSLSSMIKKSGAKNIDSFLSWLQQWQVDETNRLISLKRDVEVVSNKAECLIVLSEGCKTIEEMIANISAMFDDKDDSNRVTLMSTHRAKGLEANRAFMLNWTYRPTKGQEEANLAYVAITRAKQELYLVTK